MQLQGTVGGVTVKQGAGPQNLRQGFLNDLIVSELQGRFHEANYNGTLYRAGAPAFVALDATLTAIGVGCSGTLATAAGGKPIMALWNPSTSGVNLSVLQASLQVIHNSLTSGAGPGEFVWCASNNNAALTLGSAPINAKTNAVGSSVTKFFPGGVLLTGLGASPIVIDMADFPTPGTITYTSIASTAPIQPWIGVQNFEGGMLVPPGGVLALYSVTNGGVTFSAAGRFLFNEVPI